MLLSQNGSLTRPLSNINLTYNSLPTYSHYESDPVSIKQSRPGNHQSSIIQKEHANYKQSCESAAKARLRIKCMVRNTDSDTTRAFRARKTLIQPETEG